MSAITQQVGEVVDYTAKRRGTMTERGLIDDCPKCGRKGERVEHRNPTNGARWFEFTHTGRTTFVGGRYAMLLTEDFCNVTAKRDVQRLRGRIDVGTPTTDR